MSVSPQIGTNTTITTGATPVLAIPSNVSGGYIVNPAYATDQGFSSSTIPEGLICDPVSNSPTLVGNGSATTLLPGQKFDAIPNSDKAIYVNAATSGHKFTVVFWY